MIPEYMSTNVQKCAPDDPNRCQATTAHGQCHNLAVEDGTTCYIHGGNMQAQHAVQRRADGLRRSKWQMRIREFGEDDKLKSLNNEIGVLRLLLEERLQSVDTPMDLLIHSQPLSELVVKIEKLVVSCHKLDQTLGMLVDKQALMRFADSVITIISHHVKDADTLDQIATAIVDALADKEA